jgi:hypothetical protein
MLEWWTDFYLFQIILGLPLTITLWTREQMMWWIFRLREHAINESLAATADEVITIKRRR